MGGRADGRGESGWGGSVCGFFFFLNLFPTPKKQNQRGDTPKLHSLYFLHICQHALTYTHTRARCVRRRSKRKARARGGACPSHAPARLPLSHSPFTFFHADGAGPLLVFWKTQKQV